eukprot:gene10579-7528_t
MSETVLASLRGSTGLAPAEDVEDGAAEGADDNTTANLAEAAGQSPPPPPPPPPPRPLPLGAAAPSALVCVADEARDVPPHLRDDDDRRPFAAAADDEAAEAMDDASASSEDTDDDVLRQDAALSDDSDGDSDDDAARAPRDADADALTEEEAQLGASTAPPKTQHELDEDAALLPLPAAPEELQVQLGARREQLRLAGEVLYRIDHEQTVVIQGLVADGAYSLNEGTVLCTATGVVVGVVHEVFGPVAAPFYIVRYRSYAARPAAATAATAADGAKAKRGAAKKKPKRRDAAEGDADEPLAAAEAAAAADAPLTAPQAVNAHLSQEAAQPERTLREIPGAIQPGVAVFTVPDHATFLTPQVLRSLRTLKGSDASNAFDEEVGADEVDYSDDEAEQRARKAAKSQQRPHGRRLRAPHAAEDFGCIPPGPRARCTRRGPGPAVVVVRARPPIHVPVEHFLRAPPPPPPQFYAAQQPPPPQASYPFALPGVVYPPVAAAYPTYAAHAPGTYQYAPLTLPQQPPPPPRYHPPR